MSKTLIVVGEKTFTNGSSFVVGRHSSVDYQLGYANVSKRHAEVSIELDGQIFVRDLDSLNGTYINGQRVMFDSLDHPETDDLRLCGPRAYRLNFVRLEPTDDEHTGGVVNKYAFVYVVS